jgi:hypothetical protein
MYRFPAESTAKPTGLSNCALVAATLSEPKPSPKALLPAKVEITPAEVTLRITWFFMSEMYRFPALSTATPEG